LGYDYSGREEFLTMQKHHLSVCFILFIAVISGCSSSKKLTTGGGEAGGRGAKKGIINEFFDPLILGEDELKVKKTISVESSGNQNARTNNPVEATVEPTQLVQGYRVQICAVADEKRARQIQRDAILKFIDQDVYLIYDSPYYKVRVGNCLTRYEADQLQQLAVQKGFDDAWVVRTKVTPKQEGSAPNQFK